MRTDAELYPWVKSLTGTWHLRSSSRYLGYTEYPTLCGRRAPSVEVSGYDPRRTNAKARLCRQCRLVNKVDAA